MAIELDPRIATHPVTKAYYNWLEYAVHVGGLRRTTYAAHETLTYIPDLVAGEASDLETSLNAYGFQKIVDAARSQQQTEYKHFHAMWLVGMWGAFEAFVHDTCRGLIHTRPQLLRTEAFKNITLAAADLNNDRDAITDQIFQQLRYGRSARGGVEEGSKFHFLLKAVGINADVPDYLRKSAWEAQHVRHLWAHSAGRVDSKFLKHCGDANVRYGQEFAVNLQTADLYENALTAYVHIIFNRFCESEDYKPMRMTGMGVFQRDFDAMFFGTAD